MKRKSRTLLIPFFLIFPLVFFASCAQDGDGPLDVMPNGESVEGDGYFLGANSSDFGHALYNAFANLVFLELFAYFDRFGLYFRRFCACVFAEGENQGEYG